MGSTNKTTNYNLSQFIGTDIPSWLSDYNGDMEKIDDAMKVIEDKADTGATDITGLVARMTSAETNIANLQGAGTALDTRVTVNENNIDTVHHEAAANTQEIENINDNKLPMKVESNVAGAEMNMNGNAVAFNDTSKVRGIDFRNTEYFAVDNVLDNNNNILVFDSIINGQTNRLGAVLDYPLNQCMFARQTFTASGITEDSFIRIPINGFIADIDAASESVGLTFMTGSNSYYKVVINGNAKQLEFIKNDGTGEVALFTIQGI